MRKIPIASSWSLVYLLPLALAATVLAGCSRVQEPATAAEHLKIAEGLERCGGEITLPKRIWLYEELLATYGDELTPEQQNAVRMKLEACQRNYFANAFRDNAEVIRKDDLEQQVKAWQERYNQLARQTDSLKAENQMLRSKAVRQEETLNTTQSRGDKKK